MVGVISCIIAHEQGMLAPEFKSTTIVIPSSRDRLVERRGALVGGTRRIGDPGGERARKRGHDRDRAQ